MSKSIFLLTFLLVIGQEGTAQKNSNHDWFIGLNLPVPSFESNIGDAPIGTPDAVFVAPQHVIRPGISFGYAGFAANLYLVGINPFISTDPDNTDYYLYPPGYERILPFRYNVGYQYTFGKISTRDIHPILGGFYGIGPKRNMEFMVGLRIGRHQMGLSAYLESNRHIIPIGDRWMESSVHLKYQYVFGTAQRQDEPWPQGR